MHPHLIAEDGPFQGLILSLEEGDKWIIGRDSDTADFVLEDSTVSRKHVQITKTPEGLVLKNLSRVNPTLVNDEEHKETILLKEGDRIQIGGSTFIFSEENIPDLAKKKKPAAKKNKKKAKNYDNIFDDLETPQEETPVPPTIAEEDTSASDKSEPSAYDTIFEESPGEADVSFDLIPETPFLLKVLSGPNAGAEIGMEKNLSYVIGKDSQVCDITFQDLSVSRTHARLSISVEGAIEIEDLGSKNGIVVNGTPITEKKILTSQDLVAMGTTVFLIIDREAPQETIYSPVLKSYEPPSQETPPEETKRDWKKEPIPRKYLIAAAAFAAVFLIAFCSFFSLFKSKQIEVVRKEPTSEIKEALDFPQFSDVQFSFNPATGKLFLVGHVMTNVDYQELRYRIDQIPFIMQVEDTVVIDDGVAKSMNEVLATNTAWRNVSVRALTPGRFAAVGYLQTNGELAQANEYLTVNFPYLDRLANQIAVEENLSTEIQSMLVSHGFSAVELQLINGNVVLSGVYTNKLQSEYQEMLKKIGALSGITSVKNFAIPTTPHLAAINISSHFAVQGTSMHDGRGYNVVLNGKIYTVDDVIAGMKITNIEQNTILLEKDGIKYKIDYAQ